MVQTKSWAKGMGTVLALTAAAALGTGCAGGIRSAVHIETEPSGATVKINYVERGRTPIDIPIIWYWYYKIEIEKDGYKPIERDERFYAPFWAVPPLDLFTEVIPIPIRNTYRLRYTLEPQESK